MMAPRGRARFGSFVRVSQGGGKSGREALEAQTRRPEVEEALAKARLEVVRAATTRLFADWEQETDDLPPAERRADQTHRPFPVTPPPSPQSRDFPCPPEPPNHVPTRRPAPRLPLPLLRSLRSCRRINCWPPRWTCSCGFSRATTAETPAPCCKSTAAGRTGCTACARAFDLSEFEGAVLGLCVACELFPLRFRRVAAAALGFGDELSMGTLTPHLALLWLGGLEGASPQAFLPGGPLLRWGLLDTRAGLTFDQSLRGLSIPAGVLAFLQGHDAPDPALDGVAQLIPASLVGQVALSDSQEGLVGQLQGFLDGDPAGRAGLLYGADASARQEVARRALGGLKAGVLVVNLAGLNSSGPGSSGLAQPAKEGQPDERAARLRALARDSRLKGMAVLLDATGDTEEGAMGNLVAAAMDAAAGPVVVVCEDALPLQVARAVLPLEVHKPGVQEQRALWAAALGLPDPQLAALQRLTDQFHLDAARIGSLAREVRADLPGNAGYAARLDRAWTACRVAGRRRIGGLAQRVSTGATWDDVILADSDLSVLRQIVAHVQHRAAVNDLLGAPTGGRGRAVAALFSGPSGTGKTLSAEVVANALNLDLYRIDLSGMVSKYIGETEKNLKTGVRCRRRRRRGAAVR